MSRIFGCLCLILLSVAPCIAADRRPNVTWAAAAGIAYDGSSQPLAPILISFAARYSAGNPGLPPEAIIQKTEELKRSIQSNNLPQKVEDFAKAWDATGHNIIGEAIRLFHRDYLSDSTNEVWNSMKGFAREVASQPGFWTDLAQMAANDPQQTGKVVTSLAHMYLGIDPTMSDEQIRARVPGLKAAEEFDTLLISAKAGRIDAQQIKAALSKLQGEIGDRFEAAGNSMQQLNRQVRTLSDWMRSQEESDRRASRIQILRNEFANLKSAIAILNTICGLANAPPDLRRTVQVGAVLVSFGEAAALHAATGGSTLLLVNNGVSSFAAISSLLGDTPEDSTLSFLRSIDSKLDLLRTEMRNSFAVVNQKLDAVLQVAFNSYKELLNVGHDVESIRVSLSGLTQELWALEDRLSAEIRAFSDEQALALRANCFRPRSAISDELYSSCLSGLLIGAASHPLGPLAIDVKDYNPTEAAQRLQNNSPMEIQYLARALSAEFSKEAIAPNFDIRSIANPVSWSAGATDYAEFVLRWKSKIGTRAQKQEVLSALERVRSIGASLRTALDAMGGVQITANHERKRDAKQIFRVFSQFYSKKLQAALEELSAATDEVIQTRIQREVFESQPAFPAGFMPGRIAPCTDFSWRWFGPEQRLTVPDSTPSDQLPFYVDAATQARSPIWLLNNGGKSPSGEPRIRSVSVCLDEIVEQTNRRTCFGGTYGGGGMAPGHARYRVTLELPKQDLSVGLTDQPMTYEPVDFSAKLEFPGGEACPPGPGLQWNARLKANSTSIWLVAQKPIIFVDGPPTIIFPGVPVPQPRAPVTDPTFFSMENMVRRKLLNVAGRNRKEFADAGMEAFARGNIIDTPIGMKMKDLEGARALLNTYFSIIFPDAYATNDAGLLLAGSVSSRLVDPGVMIAILRCLDNPAEPLCRNETLMEISSNAMKSGFGSTMQERAAQVLSLLEKAFSNETDPTSYVAVEFTMAKLSLAIQRIKSIHVR